VVEDVALLGVGDESMCRMCYKIVSPDEGDMASESSVLDLALRRWTNFCLASLGKKKRTNSH